MRDINSEYKDFSSINSENIPEPLNRMVQQRICSELNPSEWYVFGRLSLIVFVSGAISLLLCPQFGIGFARDSGLFELFMTFGPYACKIFCGAFFVGISFFITTLILRPEELKVIRRNNVLAVSAFSLIWLGGFVNLGASVFIEAALVWFIGAFVGGLLLFELGYFVRKRLVYAGI